MHSLWLPIVLIVLNAMALALTMPAVVDSMRLSHRVKAYRSAGLLLVLLAIILSLGSRASAVVGGSNENIRLITSGRK